MKKLCACRKVIYQNAATATPCVQQQFNSVLSRRRKGDRARPGGPSTAAALLVKPARSFRAREGDCLRLGLAILSTPADYWLRRSTTNRSAKMIAQSLVEHSEGQESPGASDDTACWRSTARPPMRRRGLIKKASMPACRRRHPVLAEVDDAGMAPPRRSNRAARLSPLLAQPSCVVVATMAPRRCGRWPSRRLVSTPCRRSPAMMRRSPGLQPIIASDLVQRPTSKPSEIARWRWRPTWRCSCWRGETPKADTKLFDHADAAFVLGHSAGNLKAEIIDKNVNGSRSNRRMFLCTDR